MASRIQSHLKRTFLTGIFAVIPIAATAFIVWYVDHNTRIISTLLFKREFPFVGIVIAALVVYIIGLIATSLLGKFFIKLIDKLLGRLPLMRDLYTSWKQIALTPGGGEGVFARVVLIPTEAGGGTLQMGFSSGTTVEGDPNTYCVFVPAAPNPMNGRLHFVPKDRCIFIEATSEDAFKFLLSTGNYVPPAVAGATKNRIASLPVQSRLSE